MKKLQMVFLFLALLFVGFLTACNSSSEADGYTMGSMRLEIKGFSIGYPTNFSESESNLGSEEVKEVYNGENESFRAGIRIQQVTFKEEYPDLDSYIQGLNSDYAFEGYEWIEHEPVKVGRVEFRHFTGTTKEIREDLYMVTPKNGISHEITFHLEDDAATPSFDPDGKSADELRSLVVASYQAD